MRSSYRRARTNRIMYHNFVLCLLEEAAARIMKGEFFADGWEMQNSFAALAYN